MEYSNLIYFKRKNDSTVISMHWKAIKLTTNTDFDDDTNLMTNTNLNSLYTNIIFQFPFIELFKN